MVNSKNELIEYKKYLLRYITLDMNILIDKKLLSFDDFKKKIENGGKKC